MSENVRKSADPEMLNKLVDIYKKILGIRLFISDSQCLKFSGAYQTRTGHLLTASQTL